MSEVQIVWPKPDDLVSEIAAPYVDVHGILERAQRRITRSIEENIPVPNILLNSKHGLGKTLLAATLAQNLRTKLGMKVPMVTFDCSEDTKEYHLKGSPTILPDGSTAFVPGPIPLAIEMANQTGLSVLSLEELSAMTPGAQKVVNSVTDWRTGIFIPQIGKFTRLTHGARVIILATMNPAVYGGVYTINADLRSRFIEEVVPWPSSDQEMKILKEVCPYADAGMISSIIQLANDSRTPHAEYSLSTRDLVLFLQDAHRLNTKKDLEDVLTCVVNKFEGSDRDTIIDRTDAIFKTKLKVRFKV